MTNSARVNPHLIGATYSNTELVGGIVPRLSLSARESGRVHLKAAGESSWLSVIGRGEQASLGVHSDSADLTVSDENGRTRAALAVGDDGSPSRHLYDEAGKIRASVGHVDLTATRTGSLEERPASSLVLFDKDEKVIWRAPSVRLGRLRPAAVQKGPGRPLAGA